MNKLRNDVFYKMAAKFVGKEHNAIQFIHVFENGIAATDSHILFYVDVEHDVEPGLYEYRSGVMLKNELFEHGLGEHQIRRFLSITSPEATSCTYNADLAYKVFSAAKCTGKNTFVDMVMHDGPAEFAWDCQGHTCHAVLMPVRKQ